MLGDYPFPWRLDYWPMMKNPFLIAANNKPVCQIDAGAGAWVVEQTQVGTIQQKRSARSTKRLLRDGFRL